MCRARNRARAARGEDVDGRGPAPRGQQTRHGLAVAHLDHGRAVARRLSRDNGRLIGGGQTRDGRLIGGGKAGTARCRRRGRAAGLRPVPVRRRGGAARHRRRGRRGRYARSGRVRQRREDVGGLDGVGIAAGGDRPGQHRGGGRAERPGDDSDQRAVVGRDLVPVGRRARAGGQVGERDEHRTGRPGRATDQRRPPGPAGQHADRATGEQGQRGQQQHGQALRGRRIQPGRFEDTEPDGCQWAVGDDRGRDGQQRQQPDDPGGDRHAPAERRLQQYGDRRAGADHRAERGADTGGPDRVDGPGQLGRAGRLHAQRGDHCRAQRADAGDGEQFGGAAGEVVAAGEALGEDGSGDRGDHGEPAHPDELGGPPVHRGVDERAVEADDSEAVRDAQLAGPGQYAHAERREQQPAPRPKGHVRHVTARCPRSPPCRRAARRTCRRGYFSSTRRAR